MTIIENLSERIISLPGNLFNLKSAYLELIPNIALLDVDGAFVKLGQAGERMAKGILDTKRIDYHKESSFDRLIQAINTIEVPVPIIVGLRTVLKYRNQAAHDYLSILSIHDLDAALGAFCASYRATLELIAGEINISTLIDSKNLNSQYRGVISETTLQESTHKPFTILIMLLSGFFIDYPLSFLNVARISCLGSSF